VSLSTVRCRILGQAEIHTRGIRLTPESELQFGLALYFCAQAGREVPRDEIAHLFWPTHGIEAGRHCLRQAIYRLRVLGIAVRNSAKAAVLDTHFIETDYAPAAADGAPATAYLRLEDVEILPGYSPRFSRAFAHWVEDFRGEVAGRMRRGLVRAISEMRARGRYADVERLCRFCLRLDPLNEEATLALAESVALAGGKAEAVGLIDRYEGEVGRYRPDLRLSASLLRERISDRLIRRNQAAVELPMVGREEDVERVLSAFQRLRGNRAVSYVITGVAGVGKTRLASECCRMAELQGARLLTIGTQPSSRTQALFAVSELVDGLLQMPGAIGCAPAALECLRAMSSPVPMRESTFSLDADGEARFAMVRWSILDVLDAILSEGPLVIHLDDAHQLDEQSQAILQDALRTHAKRPLLLLFTMRRPEHSDAERFARLIGFSTTHDLLPLSDVSCDLLVSRFCAAHEESLDAATRERMIQLSGGNPFFLVELLKHRSELVTRELPVTVQALLEDRLGRLSSSALTLLRAAAVLGLSSTVERLHRMVEREISDVLTALTELHAAGMLSPANGGAICRHDTIREAVLERTPTAARVLLHRRAARILGREALQDGGVPLLWESVHHWQRAGAMQNGLKLLFALARRLLEIGLASDAQRVLIEAEKYAQSIDDLNRALVGQAKAARILRDWGQLQQVISSWRELRRKVGAHLPAHSSMELMSHEAQFYSETTLGSLPASIGECVSSRTATLRHRLGAATLALIRADNQGDLNGAHDVYEEAKRLEPTNDRERIEYLTLSAVFHASFGDVSRMPELLIDLVELTRRIQQPAVRALLLRRASWGICRFAPRTLAREVLEETIQVFERLSLPTQLTHCLEHVSTMDLHDSNFGSVETTISRIQELSSVDSNFYVRAVEYELRVRLAFETRSAEPLSGFEVPQDALAPLRLTARGRLTLAALELGDRLLRGSDVEVRDSLLTVNELKPILQNRCDQDFVNAAVARALLRLNAGEEASRVLREYLTKHRREPGHVLPSLALLAHDLGVPYLAPSDGLGRL
jgi:DNA-binding SARP family transcriptional activator/tetratricopeptide (TPR) repeat protein